MDRTTEHLNSASEQTPEIEAFLEGLTSAQMCPDRIIELSAIPNTGIWPLIKQLMSGDRPNYLIGLMLNACFACKKGTFLMSRKIMNDLLSLADPNGEGLGTKTYRTAMARLQKNGYLKNLREPSAYQGKGDSKTARRAGLYQWTHLTVRRHLDVLLGTQGANAQREQYEALWDAVTNLSDPGEPLPKTGAPDQAPNRASKKAAETEHDNELETEQGNETKCEAGSETEKVSEIEVDLKIDSNRESEIKDPYKLTEMRASIESHFTDKEWLKYTSLKLIPLARSNQTDEFLSEINQLILNRLITTPDQLRLLMHLVTFSCIDQDVRDNPNDFNRLGLEGFKELRFSQSYASLLVQARQTLSAALARLDEQTRPASMNNSWLGNGGF